MADNLVPSEASEPPSPDAAFRSFAVEAFVGHKANGWPFARFDVTPQALQVKLRFPWFVSRHALRPAVATVSVRRTIGGISCFRFEDSPGWLAEVHVHVPFRPDRVIDELRRCGYEVVDRRVVAKAGLLPRLRRRNS